MPTVYRRDERIPELNGRVQGGLAVVIHSPIEVPVLQQLVDSVDQLPGDTIENLYRVLAHAGRTPDLPPRPIGPIKSAGSRAAAHVEAKAPLTPVESLRRSLDLCASVWREQGDDVDRLALALVLPRPGRRARLRTSRPALVLDYGSIRARVLTAGRRLREFGVALFPTARAKRRANVVEALRDNAPGAPGAPGPRLPRIDRLKPTDLAGKTGVVIFLHGLMSTDAGTFDELVGRMRATRGFGSSLLLVSWPHDTLDSIDVNGEDLAELVERTLGRSTIPIAFVCHSRGGLVARRAAVELMQTDGQRWQPRLRGLVTFGTPHDGAELAEAGDEMIGKLLLMGTVGRQAGIVPLIDALWSVKGHEKLAGISDLRPRSGGGGFLRDLRKDEGQLVKKVGAVPLPLYAVGGNATPGGLKGFLSRRYFGGAANDLIVTLASATPAAADRTAETACDHFGYFTAQETRRAPTAGAIVFLQRALAAGREEAVPVTRAGARRRPTRPRARSKGGPARAQPPLQRTG